MADSTKTPKNYVKGSNKEVTFDNGGSLVHMDFKAPGGIETKNGLLKPNAAGYVKVTLSKLKEPDQYGNTHTLYENTFVPTKGAAKAPDKKGAATLKPFPKEDKSDSLPF